MFGWLRPKAASAATIADDVQAANEPASSVDPDRLLRRLEWTVLRRLDGVLQGDYRTLFRGFGLDLADLREYQLNDDVRYMDWNVTARLQVPHVREFQEDREVAAWFVLDLSGSVDFGSQQLRKRALASELVAVLARLFTRYGNRVGAVLHSEHANEVIPARSGRRHVLHILDRMVKLGERSAARKPRFSGSLRPNHVSKPSTFSKRADLDRISASASSLATAKLPVCWTGTPTSSATSIRWSTTAGPWSRG